MKAIQERFFPCLSKQFVKISIFNSKKFIILIGKCIILNRKAPSALFLAFSLVQDLPFVQAHGWLKERKEVTQERSPIPNSVFVTSLACSL